MGDEFITGDSATQRGEHQQVVTLAAILNVLWRRKWIIIVLTALGFLAGVIYGRVVTPLYSASATIRPGITAFDPSGGPIREWKLKDVTRWFNSGMYRKDLREKMGWQEYKWVDIKADFIMRGMQNIQGGNVITLTTLDADPIQAEKILAQAIEVFGDYARSDSVSSQIELTRSGLDFQIAGLVNQNNQLQSKQAMLNLDIAVARAESSQVDAQMRMVDLEIGRQKNAYDMYVNHLNTTSAEAAAITQRLTDLDATLSKSSGNQPDPELVQAAVQLESRKYRNLVRADSLRNLMALSENRQQELAIKRDQELGSQKANLHREVQILRLERDMQVPLEQADLANQVREKRAKLTILSPVERVGHIQVSNSPVRPRKSRAVSLLTMVAFLGSLFAAFAWEYVSGHWKEIFQSQGR